MSGHDTASRSGHHDWPRQLRLPGQAAAPDGPVDMYMMYVMHHAFRRDLAAFAAAVPRTPVDDLATWQALSDRWALFADALHHQHEGEDAWLWPALLERAEADERETLEAMEAEHEGIDPLLDACATGLGSLAAGAGRDARAALAVRMCATRESLGRHLAHEEKDAMRILQCHFTQADWDAIERRFAEGVTLNKVLSLLPWAVHGIPAPMRPELFARTGTAYRLLWRATRRHFARRDARAFRYAATRS
jgi:hemerythrin-like domain-containing protein